MGWVSNFRSRPAVGVPPYWTASPTIIGTPQDGVATAFVDGTAVNATSYLTQWLVNGVVVGSGSTYTPVTGDVGKTLVVDRIAINGFGTARRSSIGVTIGSGSSFTYTNIVGFGTSSDDVNVLVLRDASQGGTAKVIRFGNGGNDANDGSTHALRKATISGALAAVTNGAGDWIAGADGSTFTEDFGSFQNKNGHSAAYPLVVTSYNTSTGALRQGRWTMGTASAGSDIGAGACNYTYWENFDVNNAGSQVIMDIQSGDVDRYFQVYNVRFLRNYQVSVQCEPANGDVVDGHNMRKVVWRRCTFAHSLNQGLYSWKTDGMVCEYCVFYHNGWSGTDRDSGGANQFDHNAYFGTLTYNAVWRHNVSGWASSHGVQLRGGGSIDKCVFGKNAHNCLVGGGNNYDTLRPGGVPYKITDCHVSGSTFINSTDEGGAGIGVINGVNDPVNNYVRNCLVTNRQYSPAFNSFSMLGPAVDFGVTIPSYMYCDNCLYYNWGSASIQDYINNTDHNNPTYCHFSSDNGIYPNDAPTGSNVQNPSPAYANPTRTIATYATANGYASEEAFWDYMCVHTETNWASVLLTYLNAGFNR